MHFYLNTILFAICCTLSWAVILDISFQTYFYVKHTQIKHLIYLISIHLQVAFLIVFGSMDALDALYSKNSKSNNINERRKKLRICC